MPRTRAHHTPTNTWRQYTSLTSLSCHGDPILGRRTKRGEKLHTGGYLPAKKKKKTIKWLPLNDYLFKRKEAGVPFCLQLSISPNPVLGGEKLTCKMRSTTENKKATFITQLHLYLFKYWLYSYVNDKRPTVPLSNPKIPPSSIRNGEANCPPSFPLYLNHNPRKQTLKKQRNEPTRITTRSPNLKRLTNVITWWSMIRSPKNLFTQSFHTKEITASTLSISSNLGALSVCVRMLSHTLLSVTPWTVRPPGSSVHGIFQARTLEWVAISNSKGYSWRRDGTGVSCISCISRQILYRCATWEARLGALYTWLYLFFTTNK